MQIFTVVVSDDIVLCDTPVCHAEVRRMVADEPLSGSAHPATEVVLCVIEGEMQVGVTGAPGRDRAARDLNLGLMEGVQIPAGQGWSARAGDHGAKILRVDSPHPGFDSSQRLMPELQQPHRFAVASGQWLVYDDYVRGGVLNFAPGFAADRHFHQDADEIFWFFQGVCRVTGPEGAVLVEAGQIVYTPAGEWHIIENAGREPLLMFVTVTPNLLPSHTFFDATGRPYARSMAPLTHP
jgi:mannose-6-phosphate isomerase-like protein (cupin superfamily)